jgi:hypothetical protein
MLTLLLALAVGLVVWSLYAPGARFLPALAGLLAAPRVQRSPLAFFSGRAYATGSFRDRAVALRLQLKRSRYGQGYLVIAVRVAHEAALRDADIEARIRDESGRRGLSALAAQGLRLGAEDGWLKALWKPHGPMIFPGRFHPARWRDVLDSLDAVATSLEETSAAAR